MSLNVDYSISDAGKRTAPPGREEDGAQQVHLGLSKPHISPLHALTLWDGGGRMTIKSPKLDYQADHVCGKRSEITKFSKGSRRRLLYKLNEVTQKSLPVFVTLTYPAVFPQNSKTWKRDLDTFWKRLARKFPTAGCFWKLEPQKRLAPHYHLMIWGVDYVDLLRWVSQAWFEVVGSGDNRHLLAGTRVEKVRSWRGVMSYASKYLGKECDTSGWDSPGRFWGTLGKNNIPWASMVQVSLSNIQAYNFIRLMRRYSGIKPRAYRSLTIFCNAEFWLSKLDKLLNS